MLLHMFHCLPRFLHYVMMLHWILDWGVERALLQNLFEIKTHRSTSFVLVKLFYCLPSLFPACTGCPKQNHCFPIATLRVSMVSILYASVTPFAARHTQRIVMETAIRKKMNRCLCLSRINESPLLHESHRHGSVTAIESIKGKRNTRFGF